MSIHILDNNLINQIAAGEVVERPASVVKELVENSLDAGADFIVVEIKNGGMDFIEICDNGKGMNKEDAALSVRRHATSKISSIEDLHSIMTFGFRGEALAAISSVSKFSVQTKGNGVMSGTLVENDSNADARLNASDDNFKISDIGCSEGTKIRVENLFYNIPARRKFLKSAQTEFGHILNVMINIALINYKTRFKLVHNGKIIFDYACYANKYGSAQRIDAWSGRVKEILGSDNFSGMNSFSHESGEMNIEGFISNPSNVRAVKNHQYLFINSRPIYNNIVQKAVYEAYRNLIPRDGHPMFIIRIEIEPELVDVNVHPRKMEVKFLNQQEVFKTVQAAVREAIGGADNFNKAIDRQEISNSPNYLIPNKISNFKPQISNQFQNSNLKYRNADHGLIDGGNFKKITPFQFQSAQQFNNAMFCEDGEKKEGVKDWKLIGQVNNLYLIVENTDGIILIDQHAAHERMLYDKLIEDAVNGKCNQQQLLVPLTIRLSIRENESLKNGVHLLKNIGFEIEEFGVNTIIVQTVPNDLTGKDVEKILRGLISEIFSDMALDLEVEGKMIEARDKTIKYISCHSAVRGGDVMTKEEQLALAEKVLNGEIKPTCPHGRPIMTLLNWEEIGKKFKR